jgi:DNA-binding LacI/PurR family transcriptional regulator
MTDVAKAVGVSHQTVSRVVNGHPAVRSETRERVLAAIEELGYRVNTAARALASNRSGAIGVVTFDTTLYGPASTLYGVERAAREADYFVSVASAKLTRDSVLEAVERLRDQEVEGVIAIAPQRQAVRALATMPRDIPMVAVQGGAGGGLPVAAVDQRLGTRLAVDHLLEQGVETVWHVGGPADWLEAQARTDAWRKRLAAAGREVPEPVFGDWSPESGYDAGRELTRRRDVRAVFVANDQMALGVLRAFHEAGVAVPDDVLVAGFDDVPEAAYYTPPLTTVHQDFAELGRGSLRMLIDEIWQQRKTARSTIRPALVVRKSSVRG